MNSKPPPINPYFNAELPPPYQEVIAPPLPTTHLIQGAGIGSTIYAPPVPNTQFVQGTRVGSTTYIHQTTTQPTYGAIPIIVQPSRATDVIVVGGCPACRVGVLSEEFTLPGLCCAFWFFPIGILCCLAMKERRCTNCGAIFS